MGCRRIARPPRRWSGHAWTPRDTLFARHTGYWHLDERIAKTAAKKEALLGVLDHPEVPLHHNPAELGARQRVRKRDVSFGPRSQAGITAWDVFGTITQTAAKLGVNVAHYFYDRLSGAYRMPSLAALITQRAAEAHAPVALAAAYPPDFSIRYKYHMARFPQFVKRQRVNFVRATTIQILASL